MLILPLFGGSEIGCNCAEFRTPEKWFKEHSTWGNFQNPLFAFLRLEYLDIFGGFLKNSKSENFLLYINGVVCKVENEVAEETSYCWYDRAKCEMGGLKWGS